MRCQLFREPDARYDRVFEFIEILEEERRLFVEKLFKVYGKGWGLVFQLTDQIIDCFLHEEVILGGAFESFHFDGVRQFLLKRFPVGGI